MSDDKQLTMNIEKYIQGLSVEGVRDFIAEIETWVLHHEKNVPADSFQITHHFAEGTYGREMKLKAGDLIVGKIHKFSQINVLSEGEVSILSQDGVKRVKAPYTFVGTPGAKRVIYAHTNVTWTVFHGTDSQDLAKIEAEFIAKTYAEVPALKAGEEKKCLGY